jgi:hypothetical protein
MEVLQFLKFLEPVLTPTGMAIAAALVVVFARSYGDIKGWIVSRREDRKAMMDQLKVERDDARSALKEANEQIRQLNRDHAEAIQKRDDVSIAKDDKIIQIVDASTKGMIAATEAISEIKGVVIEMKKQQDGKPA